MSKHTPHPSTTSRRRPHTAAIMLACAGLLGFGALPRAAEAGEADAWAEPEKVAAVEAGERDEANVTWWGFDPEESTHYLQAAFDSPASRIIVPAMAEGPWITEKLFLNRDDVEIHFEEGAVLEALRGGFRGRGDSLLSIHDRENVVVRGHGATLRMHKDDYMEEPYRPSGWRMALSIRGSVDVTVEGVTLTGAGGDGIYLGPTSERSYVRDVVIRDVACDDNTRQGISIISAENVLIESSSFTNTDGRNPGAGICIEPNNADQRLVNIVIRDSYFKNNRLGMHTFLSNLDENSEPVSILWENNRAHDHTQGYGIGIHAGGVADDGGRGEVVYRDNQVVNTRRAGIHFRNKSSEAMRYVFENTELIDTGWGEGRSLGSPIAPIVLHARSDRSRYPGGIDLGTVRLRFDEREPIHPLMRIGASSPDWDVVWTSVQGTLIADEPGDSPLGLRHTDTADVEIETATPQ